MPRTVTVALCLSTLLFTACAGSVEIRQLLADPSGYDGEDVRISGEVVESFGVTGVGGGYRVDDGTGTLTVVSRTGAPLQGAEIEVRGIFRSVFNLGGRSLAVLEESDRDVR